MPVCGLSNALGDRGRVGVEAELALALSNGTDGVISNHRCRPRNECYQVHKRLATHFPKGSGWEPLAPLKEDPVTATVGESSAKSSNCQSKMRRIL